MRAYRHIHCIAAALLLAVLLAIVMCSAMVTPAFAASTMPADCPLHPHHQQPAACCTVNEKSDALTEAQIKLPELAEIGHAPAAAMQLVFLEHYHPALPRITAPPPPDLIAYRI